MAKHGKVKETIEFSDMPEVWKHRIRRSAETVAGGKFTAKDVATLLLLARPTQQSNALRDFADGLVHPVRDKGHSQYLASKLDAFNFQTLAQAGSQPLGSVTKTNPESKPAVARNDKAEISRELRALLDVCGAARASRAAVNDFIVCLCALAHGEELVVEEDRRLRLDMTVFCGQVSLELVKPGLCQVILLQAQLVGDVWWEGTPIPRDKFVDFLQHPVRTFRDGDGRLNLMATGEPLVAPTASLPNCPSSAAVP